jgi:hypothetical protein
MAPLPEDPYFELREIPPVTAGALLKGGVTIRRKDTREIVARVTRYGRDNNDLTRQLDDAVREKLTRLGRPVDWGKDPAVSQLLTLYLKNRDLLYGLELRAEAASSHEEANRIRAEAAQTETMLNRDLAVRVASLTTAQRLELTSATDDELARRDDGRMLDALTAKRDLAGMLPTPSPQEIARLNRLQRCLSDDAGTS